MRQILPGIASLTRARMSPRGKTCLPVLGTVCRSIASPTSRSKKRSRSIKHLLIARGVARGLLTKLRDHWDEHMIAQPILTTGPKPQAQQPPQQQQQNAGGSQSLLSMTDSSLTDLAQNTGAGATVIPQPANANKPKSNDPTVTPYVAAPVLPAPTPPALSADGKQVSLDANSIPSNAVIPAT